MGEEAGLLLFLLLVLCQREVFVQRRGLREDSTEYERGQSKVDPCLLGGVGGEGMGEGSGSVAAGSQR